MDKMITKHDKYSSTLTAREVDKNCDNITDIVNSVFCRK
jgi:hypothetical protein